MSDAVKDIETYQQAAELNTDEEFLSGSVLNFPNYGQLVMTGDLHGHRRNFEKLKKYCDLEHAGARHVILHEIIHEDLVSLSDRDGSHNLLLDAARWKCEYPDQVHFLMGNHELAQLGDHEITKGGRAVLAEFEGGVHDTYGGKTPDIMRAIRKFIRSMALAARTPNRVFISHSLPSPRSLPAFEPDLLSRRPTDNDLLNNGSAYLLVWGRYQSATELEMLAELLDVDFFICGHQPQEMGFDTFHDRMLILASDHNHGVFLPFDLGKPVTLDALVKNIRPFAGVV